MLTPETGLSDPEVSASSVTDQRDASCKLGEDLSFSFEMEIQEILILWTMSNVAFLSVKTEQMVSKEMNKY